MSNTKYPEKDPPARRILILSGGASSNKASSTSRTQLLLSSILWLTGHSVKRMHVYICSKYIVSFWVSALIFSEQVRDIEHIYILEEIRTKFRIFLYRWLTNSFILMTTGWQNWISLRWHFWSLRIFTSVKIAGKSVNKKSTRRVYQILTDMPGVSTWNISKELTSADMPGLSALAQSVPPPCHSFLESDSSNPEMRYLSK